MKFGAHVSIAGGIDKAPKRAFDYGCECFQIFTRSPRGGTPQELKKDTVESFLRYCEEFKFSDYFVHTPYYINFASENSRIRQTSIDIVAEELRRSDILKVKYVMTHLGSSKGLGRSESIARVADAASIIMDSCNTDTMLLLENSAGQGATIGETFEELAEILEMVDNEKIGVCLDTAHAFAAGYDIRDKESINHTVREFSKIIGLERLRLIHGNDSKADIGEKKDRHEHIGKGKIGIKGFKSLINKTNLRNLNMIIETPPDGIKNDLKVLKSIRTD